MIRRTLALALALLMLFAMVACGKKEDEKPVIRVGALADVSDGSEITMVANHLATEHDFRGGGVTDPNITVEYVRYPNLSAMLLDLKSGKIPNCGMSVESAKYITARDDTLTYSVINLQQVAYSMVTMEQSTEFFNILNEAIKEIKADGTMDVLVRDYLNAYVDTDPAPVEMPVIESEKTYKVAVTGDVPPMDFVTADGKPAGFNVALLSEIAKRAGVNIELVVMETGAKATALAAGSVDAYFWTADSRCLEHPGFRVAETLTGTTATEPYVILGCASVYKK